MEIGITVKKVDVTNFNRQSLAEFDRRQPVTNVYRLKDGDLVMESDMFTDDWSPERKREKAGEILNGPNLTLGAFMGNRIIGFVMLVPGLDHARMIIDSLHVTGECRHRGIGRMLVDAAKAEAEKRGAEALYVSACPAVETIHFYRAMGFRLSKYPIPFYVKDEPLDIQLECIFNSSRE